MSQRHHEMAFAQPGAGDKHDVGVLLDEVQVKQILDEHAVDLGGPVPVKLIKRLENGKASLVDATLHPAVIARGGLAADQLREVVQVSELFVGGTLGERLMILQRERQLERSCARAGHHYPIGRSKSLTWEDSEFLSHISRIVLSVTRIGVPS